MSNKHSRGTKCDCKIDWLWVRSPLEEIKYLLTLHILHIFISSLWCRGKVRRWVPPLKAQYLQNSAERVERSVLTLGSLCLPCCVRDTAWSSFNFFNLMMNHSIFSHDQIKPLNGCSTRNVIYLVLRSKYIQYSSLFKSCRLLVSTRFIFVRRSLSSILLSQISMYVS